MTLKIPPDTQTGVASWQCHVASDGMKMGTIDIQKQIFPVPDSNVATTTIGWGWKGPGVSSPDFGEPLLPFHFP